MRIGYITPEYVFPQRPDGGLANYVRNVASALVERDHDVVVFVLSDRNAEWQDGSIDIIEVKRARQLRFPSFLKGRLDWSVPILSQIRSDRRVQQAVWKYHQKHPIDILQVSSYKAVGFSLRRNGKIPVVCRVSSYTPLCRAAYGSRRSFADYLTDWLEIRQVQDADVCFAPSCFMAELFARLEGVRPTVVRTPLEVSKIEMDDSLYRSRFSGFPYVLFFGTLSQIKGVDVLADAIPLVFLRNSSIHFVFIGRDDGRPGNPKLIEYIQQKCEPFLDRIHYSPAISKSLLNPIIANAYAVVIPSRVDNYPNACLEALFFGVPVIASRNSSLDEIVLDEKIGFLFQNGDSQDLSASILRLLNLSDQQLQQMKSNILDHIQVILAEDRISQLEDLYFRTIQNAPRP